MSILAAASALRELPLFEGVSLRLLQDLVEYASLERWWEDDAAIGPMGRGQSVVGRTGVLRRVLAGGAVAERTFEHGWLAKALASSFSLAHAFRDCRSELFEVLVGARSPCAEPLPLTHWLFLTHDPHFSHPGPAPGAIDLAAVAHLLARALDRTGAAARERAAVAILGATGLTLHCWDGDRPGPSVSLPIDASPDDLGLQARIHDLLVEATGTRPEQLFHVVCVHPADPETLPVWWRQRFDQRAFHRIVYLTGSRRSLRPPKTVMELLVPGAWDPHLGDGPYFSSVVPTIVLPPTLEPRSRQFVRPPWREPLSTLEVAPEDSPFDAGDATSRPERRTISERLQRDLCRVRLDRTNLTGCDRNPEIAQSLDRWARALTNRQVGLALSGGGATSAALVPFIEELGKAGVPIDVVAGFSGGAILALYVATRRLSSYYDLRHGLVLSCLLPISIVCSEALETTINAEFGCAHLEDLDVRFVPMTVELRTDGTPRPCAVVGGTLGEGVRVSGVALGWFSPAERRGTRYVDGGVAMGVPSAVLPHFGADLVIACNSIVPPDGRVPNALLPWGLGTCLRYVPITGAIAEHLLDRCGDFWIGFLTMLRETARSGARDADVYYEVSPEETPFLDAFRWYALDRIRRQAADGRRWEDELDRCLYFWRLLSGARA